MAYCIWCRSFHTRHRVWCKYSYTSFGENTGVTSANIGFSSEIFESQTNLNYYNYRYYAPSVGRWTRRDPIEENRVVKEKLVHIKQKIDISINDYSIVDNSLLQKYDSFGLGIVIGNPLRFGSVNFENCSPEQLRLFRLIPEKGKKLSIPINGKNPKIDGVWVKGNRNWLKIPNHCYATITCEEKCKSSYKYTIYCNLAISLIKGTGGFVPDAGSTTHGTDYPF